MSTTTKNVAKAIAILSDVLSAEVENEPWTNAEESSEEEVEETVALDDYEEVVEKAEEFSADILEDVQALRDELDLHVEDNDDEDYESSCGEGDDGVGESEDEFVENTNEEGEPTANTVPAGNNDDDTSDTGDVTAVADTDAESSDSDIDEVEELKSKVTQLQDVIVDAVDALDSIISNVEDFQTESESY